MLHKALPFTWSDHEWYDTVNLFGDSRQIQYRTLWTFDLVEDVLIHTNASGRRKLSLQSLRDQRVKLSEMQTMDTQALHLLSPTTRSLGEIWKPDLVIDERMRAFSHRLLCDFNHQWRHILRNEYNSTTLQILATAVIKLSTMDFDVREDTEERLTNTSGKKSYVWVAELPAWAPFNTTTTNIIPVSAAHVVVCLALEEGLSVARKHMSRLELDGYNWHSESLEPNYVILSVKHIMLCRITDHDTFDYTEPLSLLTGTSEAETISKTAMDYLIWSTSSEMKTIDTSLQLLPTEVQDNVLRYVSAGPLAAARIGCILGIGSPCLWKDDAMPIELQEFWTRRHIGSPVESQIWFDNHNIGLVYKKARKGQRLTPMKTMSSNLSAT